MPHQVPNKSVDVLCPGCGETEAFILPWVNRFVVGVGWVGYCDTHKRVQIERLNSQFLRNKSEREILHTFSCGAHL